VSGLTSEPRHLSILLVWGPCLGDR